MGQANYSAAKAGLIGLTKATARELASRGITCNAVAPGFVLTELTQDLPDALKAELTARTPLGRFGTTEEIATAVAFLASDEAAFITGQVLAVDGGLVMMGSDSSRAEEGIRGRPRRDRLIGAALRAAGIDYDRPFEYHPDETTIASPAMGIAASGNLDPGLFTYPSLLVYAEAAVAAVVHAAGRSAARGPRPGRRRRPAGHEFQ